MNNNEFILEEDEKYGGLEADNLQEELDYFGIEDVKEYKSLKDEMLNEKIESDYHNTYYLGNGKYGTRTLKMSNKEWHKLNPGHAKEKESEDAT